MTRPHKADARRLTLRRAIRAAGAIVLVAQAGCSMLGALPYHSHLYEVPIAGTAREYILHVPRKLDAGERPALVIMLHGHGERAEHFERTTGMSEKADRERFIVAYPQALGAPSVWHTAVDGSPHIDDVAFIRTLIDSLTQRYRVDPNRIYIAGHSNGAFMAYRAGAALSSRVAALGISAGSIGRITPNRDTLRVRAPEHPVAVFIVHGKADTSVPYDGGRETDGPRRIVPEEESTLFWARSDGCQLTPRSDTAMHGNVVRDDFTECRAGTEVVRFTVMNLTHRWPTGGDAIAATDSMWAFFSAHPKR